MKGQEMQRLQELTGLGETEQSKADHGVETLSLLRSRGGTINGTIAEVAHDARNMVTALYLYCDLLQAPGVLATPFAHYSDELRLVAAACRRLIDKLILLEPSEAKTIPGPHEQWGSVISRLAKVERQQSRQWKVLPAEPIKNLAEELLANRNLLAALAGPMIALTVDVEGSAAPVHMTGEDLTRILVNLVRNSFEAMSAVGRIHITLREKCGEPGGSPWIMLSFEDNGPGLPSRILERNFEPQPLPAIEPDEPAQGGWPLRRRGFGLPITRSVVEGAGGVIHAANRDPVGASFQIELPVRLA